MPSFLSRRNTSRQDTGLTTSTDISLSSAFKEKLSFLPLDKMKRTAKVLKRYTFPKNLDPERAFDVSHSPFQGSGFNTHSDGTRDPFNATHAVPGDLLKDELFAHRQRCASESPAHAVGLCWCKVADQVSSTRIMWATFRVPLCMSDPNLILKDMFGNTIFHRLAAMEGTQDQFVYLVSQALREKRLPVYDSNTAGETFLHVLHQSWFQEGSRLDELLHILRGENFNLYATDVYGRSFYHILRVNMRGSARFPGQAFDIHRMNRRDAFGMKPMDSRPSPTVDYSTTPRLAMQDPNTTSTTTNARPGYPVPRINTQTGTVRDEEARTHAALLLLIRNAVGIDNPVSPDPRGEDSEGRNAYHCLAEANLSGSLQSGTGGHGKDTPKSNPQGHNKRKRGEDEEVDAPRSTPDSMRLDLIQGLIHANVDVNHYDKRGYTPLMSFIVNSGDATRWERDETEMVIKALIQNAGANIELRNRNGETALHLAARYGKTMPLKVLLELGANPHTRNDQGLGILQVLDRLYVTTECDDKNNARFEASRAILTRSPNYATQDPTIVDEWALR
jgi:ankyrin repeat protein